MNNEFKRIQAYLELRQPDLIKPDLIGILGLLNLFNLAMLNFVNEAGLKHNLYQPKDIVYLIITLLFDIWGLYILKDTIKRQKQFVLFSGIVPFALSIFYLVEFYEFIYLILKVKSLLYIIIAVFIFAFILVAQYIYIKRGLINGDYRTKQKSNLKVGSIIVVIIIVIGLLARKLYVQYSDLRSELVCISFVILLFGYIFEGGTHNIYKFYLIKKYEEFVDANISRIKYRFKQ